MLKVKLYDLVLLLLIIFENLFLFYFNVNNITNQFVNALSSFLTSLSIGIIVIAKHYNTPNVSNANKGLGKLKYFLYALYLFIFLILNTLTIKIIKSVDYSRISDVIPAVRILAQRLLEGKFVYSNDAWASIYQTTHPGYLPMHWLPVTLAEYFHFDPRTITFSIWAIGASYTMIRSNKCYDNWIGIIPPSLILFSYYMMYIYSPGIVGATVEIMMAGYYMLFLCGLNQNKFIVTALFMSFCLLSRYYLIFWMPLWGFVLLVSGHKKFLFKTVSAISILILFIYIIPFASKDWSILNIFTRDYDRAAFGEWTNNIGTKGPWHLYLGNGFAFLFYEHYLHTDVAKGFNLLKKVLLVITNLTVVILGVWYWFNRTKINYKIFLMASFKIYLTFFLSFILVPYSYLMITGIYVSIALYSEQARYNIENDKSLESLGWGCFCKVNWRNKLIKL